MHNDNDLAFYPCYQCVTSDQYMQSKVQSLKDLYVDAGEEIPQNSPKPIRKTVQVNCFVDSDHAKYIATRRSQTGVILYFNSAPIIW